jgi:hypothetical protein
MNTITRRSLHKATTCRTRMIQLTYNWTVANADLMKIKNEVLLLQCFSRGVFVNDDSPIFLEALIHEFV